MMEIQGIEMITGLKDNGVFVAGFNNYVDNFIFPLTMILGKVSKPWAVNLCSRWFYRHSKKYKLTRPRVEFVLKASGIKGELPQVVTLTSISEDGYDLTAKAVVAAYHQFMDGHFKNPGVHLMGQFVDEERLFVDLEKMNVRWQQPVITPQK